MPSWAGLSLLPSLSEKLKMYSIRSLGTSFVYVHKLYISWPPYSCGARIQTSDVPPSRKSISARGQVKPVGPHHCITISGSTHALQTCSRGASKTRVTTTFRIFGSVLIYTSPQGLLLIVFPSIALSN